MFATGSAALPHPFPVALRCCCGEEHASDRSKRLDLAECAALQPSLRRWADCCMHTHGFVVILVVSRHDADSQHVQSCVTPCILLSMLRQMTSVRAASSHHSARVAARASTAQMKSSGDPMPSLFRVALRCVRAIPARWAWPSGPAQWHGTVCEKGSAGHLRAAQAHTSLAPSLQSRPSCVLPAIW